MRYTLHTDYECISTIEYITDILDIRIHDRREERLHIFCVKRTVHAGMPQLPFLKDAIARNISNTKVAYTYKVAKDDEASYKVERY